MESVRMNRRNIRTFSLVIIPFLLLVLIVRQEQLNSKSVSMETLTTEHILAASHPTAVNSSGHHIRRGLVGGFSNGTTMMNTQTKSKTHIAFLKVHKAASSTVQNILYRFGISRDLTFVIPYKGHYISRTVGSYTEFIPPLDKSMKYDILCNHAVFNHEKFKSLMHEDAFYVAIVREPLARFVSAAYYYRYVFSNPYLSKMNENTFLHDLITDPLRYEPDCKQSRTFNHQAIDFGLPFSTVKRVMSLDEWTMKAFVSNLLENFHFVMIAERFDESLVMLKRYMNWHIKDILYIRQNELRNLANITVQKVSEDDAARFKLTNHLDYLIYNRFLERFSKQAALEKDLDAEVDEFRHKLELVEAFCTMDTARRDALFWETKFNSAFRVNREDCKYMMTDELSFCEMIRIKQLALAQGPDAEIQILA